MITVLGQRINNVKILTKNHPITFLHLNSYTTITIAAIYSYVKSPYDKENEEQHPNIPPSITTPNQNNLSPSTYNHPLPPQTLLPHLQKSLPNPTRCDSHFGRTIRHPLRTPFGVSKTELQPLTSRIEITQSMSSSPKRRGLDWR